MVYTLWVNLLFIMSEAAIIYWCVFQLLKVIVYLNPPIFFDSFMSYIPQKKGESSNVNVSNWSLDNVIPDTGYYFYQASLPYPPCTGTYNIIVFDSNTPAYISTKSAKALTSVIEKNTYTTKSVPSSGLYYHKPVSGSDIYIDCHPVNVEGEEEGDEEEDKWIPTWSVDASGNNIDSLMQHPAFVILLGIGTLIIFKRIYNKFLEGI